MSKYDVFCDESGYLEHDIFQYMLNGGIWCEQEARRKINSKIIDMKNMSNFAGEVETSRASPWYSALRVNKMEQGHVKKMNFLKKIISFFFKSKPLSFRCIVVDKRNLTI